MSKEEQEFTNTLYTNDNLFILNGLNSNLVDLIYLDPPFNTKKMYSAPVGSKAAGTSFKDMWTLADVNEAYLEILADKYPAIARFIGTIGKIHSKAMMSYLTYMVQRIIEMHRVLKDTGSFYLHCDPTASHYLKILLDDIFGKNNFRNEISWCYTGPSGAKKNFPAKHDVILRYSKSDEYIFNWKDIRIPYVRLETGKTHSIFKKSATLSNEGKIPEDYWYDIPSGGHISPKERTGYRTQKPLALLHRIIKASSNEGDIVMDPFCGCATTCVAAQQFGRKWIGIDLEENAVRLLVERLSDERGMFKDFINTNMIPQRTDVKIEGKSEDVRKRLYKEQKGRCNGCGNEYLIKDLTIDHIIPDTKGGGSYYENYQLLCGHCNSIKGARPMEYLRNKIKVREKELADKIIFGE